MLEFLGIIFIIILVAVPLGWLTYIWRAKQQTQEIPPVIEDMLQLIERTQVLKTFPDQVKLTPIADRHITEPPINLKNELLELDFEPTGCFNILTFGALFIHSFSHLGQGFFAAIYEHPEFGTWFSLSCYTEDQRNITIMALPEALPLNANNQENSIHTLIEKPLQSSIAELYAELVSYVETKAVQTIRANDFSQLMANTYHDHITWIKQALPNATELHQMSQQALAQLPENQRGYAETLLLEFASDTEMMEKIQRDCFLAFAKQSKLSTAEWEEIRYRLYVVCDEMNHDFLDDQFYELNYHTLGNQINELDEDFEQSLFAMTQYLPRQAFQVFNQQLPEYLQLKKLDEVDTPIAADLYIIQL